MLIACVSEGTTLTKLSESYEELTKQKIPFTFFKFASLRELLEIMSEVHLRYNDDHELCVDHEEEASPKS